MKVGSLMINRKHGYIGVLLDSEHTASGIIVLTIFHDGRKRQYSNRWWEFLKKV